MPKRARAGATPQRADSPWWLDGDEECPHCEQRYAHEIEARCERCDAPICALCIVRAGRSVLCPDCGRRGRD
jgi:hypothetical protein